MRIRTQLMASLVLACTVTALLIGGSAYVTHRARLGFAEQAESQEVARDVANMLSLTNEFSVYGGGRAAQQWHACYDQLRTTVERALGRPDAALTELRELRANIDDLPTLFAKLEEIGTPESPFDQRRRDLLLERLLSETQEVIESRHRWAVTIGAAQQRDEHRYALMMLATPAVFLLLIVSLGLLVGRRVLRPLEHLKLSAAAIQRGDLSWRCESDAEDELGEAARAVDAMALALQRQSAALGESERRLRMIADNLPAMIAYVDGTETYRFINAQYKQVFGEEPEALLGKTMSEVLGAPARAALSPHVEGVLNGERRQFERHGMGLAKDAVFLVDYIPQIDAAGSVEGFYVMATDITARKAAEAQHAARERLLVQITDNVPALVAYIDLDMRYQFANAKYREWLGVDNRAMIGRHVRDAVGEAYFQEVREQGAAALQGEHVRWERQTLHNGRLAHVQAEFIPDVDAQGRVQGYYALTVDITERKNAEVSVARNEQRLFDLTNNIPAMVGYFDMEERCSYANETLLRSLGLSTADVPGIKLRIALGEANYARHHPFVQQALDGRRARLEGSIPFEGRPAHFQVHLIPDRVDGGAQRGFYLMNFDITALKEAQAKQGLVERKLRDITDNLPVLISYIDANQRYSFINATCRHWFGAEAASVIGRTVAESMPAIDYARRRGHLETALAGQRVEFDVETPVQGVNRHLRNVYVPDIRPDGSVAGVYTLSTDMTALKQVEQQLSRWARFDTLTELPNRRQFEERITEALARAKRDNKPMAVMFLDIDHFKSINDSLGHFAGDSVLREFANRLRAAVRITDTPARFAGDEFVVLLEGIHSEDDAVRVAQKVLEAIRRPFEMEKSKLHVTTSIGIAYAAVPIDADAMMLRADQMLYQSKDAGRDTFRVGVVEREVSVHTTDL